MKCFYHLNMDAVGTCSQCGKVACRECIEDIKGTLLCSACLSRARQEANDEQKQLVLAARRKLVRTKWIAAIAMGAAVIIGMMNQELRVILLSPVFGYCFGGFYLGVTRVWGWWTSFWSNIGCFLWTTPVGWLLLFFFFFYIPLIVGYFYGVFGGGIYEYFTLRNNARLHELPDEQ